MKKISADKLTKAKYWRSKGMSIRDICIKTGLKKSTIHEHLKELKPVTLTKPVGSPKKLSSKLRNLVRRGFEHGCFKTSTAAKKYLINNHNLIISNQTIRNELHSIGMKSYARPLKPLLSNVQKVNRLNFAKAMIKVDTDFWEGVIFTDESKYNIFAPDGYHKVWRYSGPPTLRHHVRETVKFGGGNVMVWGAITSKGVGKLVFIDDKMDSRLFISVLSKGFKETLQMHNLSEAEVYLQQDNDPKHTSKYSKKCIEEANIEVLS